MKYINLVCVFLATFFPSLSEGIEMITDRPDQTESSAIISPGWVQVETGAVYTTDKSDDSELNQYDLVTTLLRVGVIKNIEFRADFGYTYLNYKSDSISNRLEGLDALTIGTKFKMPFIDISSVDISLLLSLTFPAGSKHFNTSGTAKSIIVIADADLNDWLSAGINLGIKDYDGFGSGFIYSFVLGFDIAEKTGGFIEIFGGGPVNVQNDEFYSPDFIDHLIDGGLTYNLLNNVQLDASVGYAITEHTNDMFVNAGVSFRLPE